MTTKKKFRKILFSASMLMLTLALTLCGQQMLGIKSVSAAEVASNSITITNSDFNSSSSTALQSSPSGWSKIDSSSGKSGIITVKDEDFKNRASTYALESTQNPGKPYNVQTAELDNHILMINANSEKDSKENNNQGYESNSISLDAYGFYKISVWVKAQSGAFGSVYLSGLEDEDNAKFEKFENTEWTEYRFYVATGIDKETVKLQLWLGTNTLGSYNAVFFDHITAHQISESYYAQEANSSKTIKVIDYREYETSLITNADFETGNIEGWTVVDHLPLEAHRDVFNVNVTAAAPNDDLKNVGSSLTENNKFAFALHSEEKTAFGYKSTSFEIKPYQSYKISFFAKAVNLDGNAYAKLIEENDVLDFYGLDPEDTDNFYTPQTSTITISSTGSSELTNDYAKYTFYVRGHELYKTSLHIELWLGTSDAKASGSVVFDDIKFEKISSKQFENAGTSNAQKLTLSTLSGTPSVANAAFNIASSTEKDIKYPLAPASWKHTTGDSSYTKYGIINTNSKMFDEQKANYGNIFNPGNPNKTTSTATESNNVLMLWNSSETYQYVTSPSLSLSANKYYNITFSYRTIQQVSNQKQLFNVYLLDSDGNELYQDTNLHSEEWSKYTIVVRTTDNTSNLTLKLGLGAKDAEVKAYAFIDNVSLEENKTMTAEMYETYVQSGNALDFAVGNFNIISENQEHSFYEPYRYTRTLTAGTNPAVGNPIAFGGIIDGSNNDFAITNSPNNTNTLKYMPAIRVDGKATYTLTGKDSISLSTGSYYKFTIDIYSRFAGDLDQTDVEESKKAKFGASFTLSGLDENISEINTESEWVTYTIYVKATESKSVNLEFALMSESNNIAGIVAFDNYKMETIEEADFTAAQNYGETSNTLIIGATDETEDEEETPDDNAESKIGEAIWVLIPSLILAVALIVALVAYFMKKVKIKKWERKKVNEYDRESTLYRDVIRQEAEKQRQQDIAKVKAQISEVEKEIERIEEINKQRLKDQRASGTKTISRQTEREFKTYANKHTRLENQITALNEKIATMETPEYVLSVQKRIISEKVRAEKESRKANYKK